ncbi:hypothetical protein EV215_0961 [Hypnocyclicus thermotrophus]|uniref:Uncharacterized protein n=1 Tax=Hypnocyclicus thermotrophus TaxID=1627895 RepID=A0AA46DZB3_9FUSO|nr:hypothetical protein [Hypnocyclicus thermotrophus]TDT71583.1 hypothetical protein EV215_0961 [Hypnocyclicus thermotrophus]
MKIITNDIKKVLDEIHKLENALEKAYAEENHILVKEYTKKLETLNEEYASLRKNRHDKINA